MRTVRVCRREIKAWVLTDSIEVPSPKLGNVWFTGIRIAANNRLCHAKIHRHPLGSAIGSLDSFEVSIHRRIASFALLRAVSCVDLAVATSTTCGQHAKVACFRNADRSGVIH